MNQEYSFHYTLFQDLVDNVDNIIVILMQAKHLYQQTSIAPEILQHLKNNKTFIIIVWIVFQFPNSHFQCTSET